MSSPPLRRVASFLRELKRRKVYQVTAIYLVLAVGGLELLDLLIPATSLPEWSSPLILSLAIVGLPTVLVLAWTFDITPEGVVKTGEAGAGADGNDRAAVHAGERGGLSTDDRGSPGPSASPAPVSATGGVAGKAGDSPSTPGTTAGAGPVTAAGSEVSDLDPLSVAVLPFDNLSGSSEAEPFAVGLHDDLLTELSRASALTVISRTSVRGYLGTQKSIREIGRELNAGTIVEGGVQMAGDRIRLNIQLIDARNDAHRWAERYDRQLSAETIFDLQSELATNIMKELEARLTAAEEARIQHRPTDDLEAYRLYHLGREAFIDRSQEGIEEAIRHFESAVERDPGYAHAWAGLGMALVALVDYGHAEDGDALERGRQASYRAMELDPDLPEAHAAVGNYHGGVKNGPAALDALQRAMRLGPGLVLGFQWASWIHLCTGHPEEAVEAAARATRLDPIEPEARANLALARMALGEPEIARREAVRISEARPGFSYAHWVAGLSCHVLGRLDEGHHHFGQMREPHFQGWVRLSEGLERITEGTSDVSALVQELVARGHHFEAAVLSSGLGETDRFFSLLRQATPLFWDEALVLRYWHIEALDRLRGDDRYQGQLAELDRAWGVAD